MNNYEFLTRGEEVFLLTEDTKTISLPEAVSGLAIATYAELLNWKDAPDPEEKKRLEAKILFQSKVLSSLTNACEVIRHFR